MERFPGGDFEHTRGRLRHGLCVDGAGAVNRCWRSLWTTARMNGLPVCDQRAAVYYGRRQIAKLPGRGCEVVCGEAAKLAEDVRSAVLDEVVWNGELLHLHAGEAVGCQQI